MLLLSINEVAAAFATGFYTPAHLSYALTKRQPSHRFLNDIHVYEIIRGTDIINHALLALWFYSLNKSKIQLLSQTVSNLLTKLFLAWCIWHCLKMVPALNFLRWFHFVNWLETASFMLASVVICMQCNQRSERCSQFTRLMFFAGVLLYIFTRVQDYVWW